MSLSPGDDGIDRRTYLAALAGASAASLAGCSEGGGDGGDGGDGGNGSGGDSGGDTGESGGGEQGERVPELVYEFSTGLGNWSEIEQTTADIASSNIEDALGVPVEASAKEVNTLWGEQFFDARVAHFYAGGFAPDPQGLDPNYFLQLYHIQYAGSQDGLNPSHYHNCEYTDLVEEQFFAPNLEEREGLVQQAMEVFSEDVAEINTFPVVGYSGMRTDQIELDEELLGDMGVSTLNFDFLINMQAIGDARPAVNVSGSVVSTDVHTQIQGPSFHHLWSTLVYSPLLRYDRNTEITTDLAENYEITDEAQTYTFELRDTTFHDGEPVTPEDVKFTLELYNSPHDGLTGAAGVIPYDSIETIDDRTVQINFPVSYPTYLTSAAPTALGILPQHIWEPAGAPEELDTLQLDEVIGSGPYVVDTFRQGEILQLEPNEDHYNVPNQGLDLRAFQDTQSAFREFQDGNLPILANPSGGMYRELEGMDDVFAESAESFTMSSISPQMSWGPCKFREFRLAVSQCLNRAEMNEAAAFGDSTPHLYSAPLAPEHDWYPDDHEGLTQIASDPQGDPEEARQTLEEEGWSWDDDGRLRYPPGADLSPKWGEEESPMDHPDEFPCVETIPEHLP